MGRRPLIDHLVARLARLSGIREILVVTNDRFTPQFIGCMVYHPKHHHWHVEGFAAYRLGFNPLLNRDHGHFDQIGSGPLNRRVDRSAFGELANLNVPGIDVREKRTPAKNRGQKTIFTGLLFQELNVFLNLGIPFEITLNKAVCFGKTRCRETS